ncbi:SecDF P1 head subdomain-containing protein [Tsukamurella paurometabola]|uniref:Preprotein translocase subunit SecD n=1 Tax=Tsukamurella paurometabola TaxID=2061 RepID=A0A3P8KGI6_TSUPA|nr:hypothetical protein [Tsukamurella paurometabola]UEA82158.1 hypothetical protein LK411_17515 [Tsukamurella paurometabola]VDR39198.1 preprotein translocase subunit SecD [Tsukamurella paurometabola]
MGFRSIKVLGVSAMITATTAVTACQGVAAGAPVAVPQVPQIRLVTNVLPTTPAQCGSGSPAATEPARMCNTAGDLLYEVDPSVTRFPVKRASAGVPQNQKQWVVTFELADADATAFADLTARTMGKQVAIAVGGRVLSAPVVNEPIRGGQVQVTGRFDERSAKDLAQRLQPS